MSPAWNGDFTLGPFAVGYRTVRLTRSGPEGPRDISLSVWYPAEASEAPRLQVADYFQAILAEDQLTETIGLAEPAAFSAAMTGVASSVEPDRARSGLEARVLAQADPPAEDGSYPLVLWSSRHATVLAQAPLSEVLASHGFVVATAWSSDPPLAFLWEDRSAEEKLATIEAHTGDLSEALRVLRLDENVDGRNVVMLAWSYGGQTAARLQEQDDGVVGIVALDANVVPARPEESLELRQPLVYLVGRDTSGRGFDRLQRLTAPWSAVRFVELAHGNFNAMEGYLPESLGADTLFSWSLGGQAATEGYPALTRVVTAAVQHLSDKAPASMAELAARLPEVADVPVEVLTDSAAGGR